MERHGWVLRCGYFDECLLLSTTTHVTGEFSTQTGSPLADQWLGWTEKDQLLRGLGVSVVVLETMVLVSSGLEAKSAGLGLGLAFKQDQDLTNFYCAISVTKLWLLYITDTHCPRFDMMHASLDFMQSWNCICLYQRHMRRLKGCSATVAYLWGHIVPDWENLCYPTLIVFLKCNRHLDY